jgi:tetratricopeptide (TPR) repeat protein
LQTEALARELHDNTRLARSLNLLGSAYYYHSEYEQAEEAQRRSIEVCTRYNLSLEKPNALGSLALALQAQSKFQEAIETYYDVLKIEEANRNPRGLVKSLTNLAILYRNLGDYENALKCAMASYKILMQSVPDWESAIASTTNTIGLSYLDMHRYDSAVSFLQEAYRLNKKTNNLTFTANSASNIAYCYLKQDILDSASVYAETAFQLLSKVSNQAVSALILINLGSVRYKQGRLTEALKFTQEGLAVATSADLKERMLDGYSTLSEIYNTQKDYKRAYEYSSHAYQLNDSLQVLEAQRKAANLQRDYEIRKKQQSIDALAQEAILREEKIRGEAQIKVYLMMLIVLLVITAGATYYGFRQKIKSNKRLQAKNDEIAYKNELLERVNRDLQDQALRSQMKPHFIFNALNSIQYLIIQKENDKAYDYLSKFSQLLRSALEFSDQDFIELERELKWLELYVALESLRFNHGFQFKIESSLSGESLTNTKLPPFLIQPFLENAIAHGLMTKSSDRLLILRVNRIEHQLNIAIADNGIGREASSQAKAANGRKHRSFGVNLVSKRLEILSTITEKNFACIVEDGINASGEKEGTVVKLQLPV